MKTFFKTFFILLASLNLMGQVNTDTLTVNINPTPPKVEIKAIPNVIFTGDSTVVSTLGCNGSIVWKHIKGTATVITERPTITKWYTAYCLSNKMCVGEADSVQVIVKANIPKIVASPAEICQGDKSILTASGCVNGTYKWSTSETGNSIIINPIVTTTYQVTCINKSGESEPASVTVVVITRPTEPTLSASKYNINTGETAILMASGCNGTLKWSNGSTGTVINVTPTKTTTFSVYCSAKCDGASSSITIGVYSPTPTIEGSNKEVCSGNEATLTAFGCNGSVEWSNGSNNVVSIKVNPTVTTTYQAYCNTSSGRSAPANFTITVYGYPSAPTVNSSTIVVGNYLTLIASGCGGTYQWNIGANTQSISVNPTGYTEYKVKCVQNGCSSGDAIASVNVVSPNSEVYAAPDKICKGQSTILFVKNCNGTYKWSTGTTGESISVSPTVTTQYNVVCSTVAGDGSPAYITVTVFDLPHKPIMYGDTLINSGKTATLKTVCLSSAVKWSTGDTLETIIVKPIITTWYKAYCVNSQGCVGIKDSIRVRVSTPPIEIIPKGKSVKIVSKRKQIEICEGERVQLDLIGCENTSKVIWNTGEIARKIFIQPILNKSYWASCTDNAGTKYDSLDVIVYPKSKIDNLKSDTTKVISGYSATLKVRGCNGKVTWLNNLLVVKINSDSLQVTPNQSISTYSAFCTNVNGCNSDTLKFIIIALPAKPKVEIPTKICEGSNIVLKSSACPVNTKYIWEISQGIKKEKHEGNVLETVYSKNNTYVIYCSYINNVSIKGDTLNINLKPTPISLDNVIVYPNPTYDIIKIASDGCLNGIKLKLWDISGRLLYDGLGIKEREVIQLSLEDIPSAEYVLQISVSEPQKTVNKLILKANKK